MCAPGSQDRVNEPEELKRDLVELWRMCLTNVPDPRKFLEVCINSSHIPTIYSTRACARARARA